MPSPSLETSLVRILTDDQDPRRPVGAGFLVTPQHILTCAHVVNDALERDKYAAHQPDIEVFLDFPLLTNRPLLRAKILHWFPVQEDSFVGEIEDIAVLEIMPGTSLPDEARPAPVVLPHEQFFFNQRVRMCGFPVDVDNGTYANGVLQGPNAKGGVEIHHQGKEQVEAGFSGTAVWSVQENAVYGMTVSILNRQKARVAYMIPAAMLIKACPFIHPTNRLETRYIELTLKSCGIIDPINLLPNEQQIPSREVKLRRLYVSLRMRMELRAEDDKFQENLERHQSTGWRQTERFNSGQEDLVTLGERLGEVQRLVVLGDPGAGKSTLLRWLATAYLLLLQNHPDWHNFPDVTSLPEKDWLPILIRCRDLPTEMCTLETMLQHSLRKSELPEKDCADLCALLLGKLQRGEALLLVDGLDEITESGARARFADQLEKIRSVRLAVF